MNISAIRTRWAAVGAAVAISMGAGGIGIGHAVTDSGAKPIVKNIEPCRLASTRPAPDTVGSRTTGIGPDETYDLDGWGSVGNCNLPNGTAGLALNVTAVGPTAPTFLTIFPAGVARPVTSNLNPTPGQPPTPNAVNVDLNASGRFSVYNLAGSVHVIVDVVGIYDDHNHDDRYYTEAEVDAQIAQIEVSVTNVESNVTNLSTSVTEVEEDLTEVTDDLAAVEEDVATGYALGPLPAITFGAPDPQILAEFSLPAGDYLVTASVVANNNSLTTEARANCILTLCPLCQGNLELLGRRAHAGGNGRPLPILYFTQLLGLALGCTPREVGLRHNLVPIGIEPHLLAARPEATALEGSHD